MLAIALALSALLPDQVSQETFRSPDGVAMHFERTGTGEPVVVLAGGPGFTPSYMKPVCDQLAKTIQCVLLHQRGTGRSLVPAGRAAQPITLRAYVADLEALRNTLGRSRLTLVGHSWGGMLAMAYAAAHPDRIKALVLLASGGPTLEYMSWYGKNSQSRMNDEDRRNAAYWEDQKKKGADPVRVAAGVLAAGMSSTFHDRTKVNELAESLDENPFSAVVFDQMMQDLRGIAYDLRPQLKAFSGPVLVVQGRQDPIATADTLRATFPSARLQAVLIDEAGHFLWLERPDAMFGAVDSFLRSVR
jgi:proline iminopeptidase